VLGLPVTLGAIATGSQSLADQLGARSFSSLLRLSPGGAPGTWPTAYAFPLAAALALVFAGERFERTTRRAALAAVAGLYLAWASAAGYLPLPIANTSAYLGVAAFEFAMLIGLGLVTLLPDVTRVAFGRRQLAAGLMAVLLAVGLGAQAIQVAKGSWLIGSDVSPAAYVAVNQPSSAAFRVLWIGAPDGEPFPSPGGLPERTVAAGDASIRFAVTAPTGASALDLGRLPAGTGYDHLERALTEILSGSTRHGGALLAPFGIRFVVAMSGDLPRAAIRRFGAQIDLDVLPTQGLTILRSSKAVPVASSISGPEWRQASASGEPLAASALPAPRAVPLARSDDRYSGSAVPGPGLVLLAQQFSGSWRLRTPTPGAHAANPVEAFGWAVGFPMRGAASSFTVTFEGQRARTIEVTILALLWFSALWLTRRPARGG
jgi:hypothetical protein